MSEIIPNVGRHASTAIDTSVDRLMGIQTAFSPQLAAGGIHLWFGSVDRLEWELDLLSRLLVQEELERAKRLAFDELRTRFIARRGLLRIILAAYCGVPA